MYDQEVLKYRNSSHHGGTMQLDDEVMARCVAEVKDEYEANGHRLYLALDKVVEKVRGMYPMNPTDANRLREVFATQFNAELEQQILESRARQHRKFFAGGRYSGRDLASGAEAEDRNEQVALEFNAESDSSKNKGAA